MKRFALSTALLIAFTGAAAANTCTDEEQIGHALNTFVNECNGSVTSYAQTLISSTGVCLDLLETDFNDMAVGNNGAGQGDTDQICAAAEDAINKYALDNDLDLIDQ